MNKINQLPLWLKHHILKYYICQLKPSDLIPLYAHSETTKILKQLSAQEWSQIYQNDHHMMLSVGKYHNLVIRDGKIISWGNDYYGRRHEIPVLPKGTHYVSVSAGAFSNLAIRSDGQIVAWGNNDYGKCTDIPILPKDTYYLDIYAGGFHNLALRSDGEIIAWGDNYHGQCTNPKFVIKVSL